ncbi:MAG: hypothetical protein KFF73_04505 [Cyclobacteriaceae bacterium]|nr:hypothetical protein [Cyclobacteriaceae bacterium]
MYQFILFIHSWLRWFLLLLAIIVIIRAFYGWIGNKDFTISDNKSTIYLVALFHIQLLIGLILYFFLSPITTGALHDFGMAMKYPALRYWAVEHIFIMLLSIIIAQIGRIQIKKAHADRAKFRSSAIYFTLALVLIISRIPWTEAERMIRGF